MLRHCPDYGEMPMTGGAWVKTKFFMDFCMAIKEVKMVKFMVMVFVYRDENTTSAEVDVTEHSFPDLEVTPGIFSKTREVSVDEDVWSESVFSHFFFAFFIQLRIEIVQRWFGKKKVRVAVSIQWAIFRLL